MQEALEWAREIDHSMIPLLLFVEGRIAGASGGQADAYVKAVKEALALMGSRHDASKAATLNASLRHTAGLDYSEKHWPQATPHWQECLRLRISTISS